MLEGEGPEQHEGATPEAPAATQRDERLTVVGIGASAGGLPALQAFFSALPPDSGLAFVVVTHMDPQRESMLPDLLQKKTEMRVRQVHDQTLIEKDNVYVIAPGRRIRVTDSHLDTEPYDAPRGQRMPIDYFFRSLGEKHHQAVAVVLSGGGADGAAGVKTIKEDGGLLLVQDPEEAQHDSMPRAVIATGLADLVLPAGELAEKLAAFYRARPRVAPHADELSDGELDTLQRILTQVQLHTGYDFSQYKRTTLLRRIQRRMQLGGELSLEAYLRRLRNNAPEARALFNDLLVGVTNFFRDHAAWEILADKVIPRLFEGKGQGDSVRVWSIGCATGEEAYSLAILLLEHAEQLEGLPSRRPGIQVFASDLDNQSLTKAREGVYAEAIEADVSHQRLDRWFVKQGHYYRVRQELRDLVLFSNHSVLRDPPFARLDLVSCRNLLIYLNRDLQEDVFRTFHYAVQGEGYLFLGSAESAEMMHGLFQPVDKHHRIYHARPTPGERPIMPALPLRLAAERRHRAALEHTAPPSLLVNEQYQIVHLSESVGRYLLHPRGAPTSDVLKLVRPELQLELRSALAQAFEQMRAVLSGPVAVQFNGAPRPVMLAVRPRRTEEASLALVFFLEDESGEGWPHLEQAVVGDGDGIGPQNAVVQQLEMDNQRLRERLRATTEEYETSHEELKAANEELQSINEEYRSTTEELETSKEELQSVNEELQTVNSELKNKLQEVSRAHSDLENLMAATNIATLFLDRDLRIQRYTESTAELFNIMPGDHGRPLEHLTNRLNYDQLTADASRVLSHLTAIEREVQNRDGGWFLIQLRPYITVDDRIDGVVVSFVDISEMKQTEVALRTEKEFSEKIVGSIREGLLVLQPDLTVEFANEAFFNMFQVEPQQTIGAYIYDLGNGQWNLPELRTLLEEILPRENVFNGFRVAHTFEEVGHRVMLLNARRLDHVDRILLAIEDISHHESYERELLALNESLERRVVQRTEQVQQLASRLAMAEQSERARVAQMLHDDLQQQLYGIQLQMAFVREQAADMAGGQELLQEVDGAEGALQKAITAARHLSVELSPPILQGEGLADAIGWLASEMQERYRLRVHVDGNGSFEVDDLGRRVLLFHAVRELLFNCVKHAEVTEATVRLRNEEDAELGRVYRIDVEDDGVGFEAQKALDSGPTAAHRGLHDIRERLRFINGRLELRSQPGKGTRATIIAPPHEPST